MNSFPFHYVDLTHSISSSSPTWEGDCGFFLENTLDYNNSEMPVTFRVQKIQLHAGIGTHIDAPAHCFANGKTIEKLKLESLITPCIVIDVEKDANATYQLTIETIKAFEVLHGNIPTNAFVLIHTGWCRFWPEKEKYRNQGIFPSVSAEAAEYLLTKNIAGLGIDTLSPDTAQSDYPVHHRLLSQGKYIVENISNALALPPTGSFIVVLPIKITEGTESPVRLIGLIPKSNATALQNLIELERDTRNFGFDWPDQQTIIEQALSECQEIAEAIHQQEPPHRVQEEIGDLLHTAISLCIFSGYDVEETLAKIVNKFGARMTLLKEIAYRKGFESLEGQSFEFMLELWKEAKARQ